MPEMGKLILAGSEPYRHACISSDMPAGSFAGCREVKYPVPGGGVFDFCPVFIYTSVIGRKRQEKGDS